MSFPCGGTLELLTPGMSPGRQAHARKLTTFLSLLLHDSRSESTTALLPDPGRASAELARHESERAGAAVESLLGAWVCAHLGPDSFGCIEPPEWDEVEAWGIVQELHPLPAARAFPRSVDALRADDAKGSGIRRLMALAERVGLDGSRMDVWRARVLWASRGPVAALPALRECLETARGNRGRRRRKASAGTVELTRRAVLARGLDVAGAELDRGRPAAALELLSSLAGEQGGGTEAIGSGFPGTGVGRLQDRAAERARAAERLLGWARLLCARSLREDSETTELGRGARSGGATSSAAPGTTSPSGLGPGVAGRTALLPGPLLELRADGPEWLPRLLGRGAALGEDPIAGPAWLGKIRDCTQLRAAIGARGVLLYGRVDGGFRPVDGDCSRMLDSRFAPWTEALDGSWLAEGHPLCTLLETARPVRARARRRAPGAGGRRASAQSAAAKTRPGSGRLMPPPGLPLLDGETLSLVAAPVMGSRGDVAGWIYAEFDHHLIPTESRLLDLAQGMSPALWSAGSGIPGGGRSGIGAVRPAREHPRGVDPATAVRVVSHSMGVGVDVPEVSSDDSRALPFERLVAELGVKTVHRRWWGLVRGPGHGPARWTVVASGGGGLSREVHGGAGGLQRVADTCGRFAFTEPDARLSLHRDAASGWAVPLRFAGRTVGILSLESARRSDFRTSDLERAFEEAGGREAVQLDFACFAHRRREFGDEDLHFDAESPGFDSFARRLDALRGTRHAVTFVGPRASGKATFARWLHGQDDGRAFGEGSREFQGSPGSLRRVRARDWSGEALAAWESVAGSNLLLTGIEELPSDLQRRLAEVLRRRSGAGPGFGGGRWVLTQGVGGAPLESELEEQVARLRVSVPGLAQRRGDIPGLAAFLLERLARREGIRPARLSDGARALLWRQPWPNNLRGLVRVLHPWALSFPGAEIGVEEGVDAWVGTAPPPVARLEPAALAPGDLASALHTTRTGVGRRNKTRAALYLGWDTATLNQHLRAAGRGAGGAVPDHWR